MKFKTGFILTGILAVSAAAASAQIESTASAKAPQEAEAPSASAEQAETVEADKAPQQGLVSAAPSDPVRAEWEFLKTKGADKDEDVLALALPQLSDWLFRNPENENADSALLLKAGLHLKLGDHRSAVIDLMKHMREYPQSPSAAEAAKLFIETLERKVDGKTAPRLADIAQAPVTGEKADRLAGLLEKTAEQAGKIFYEPLTAEFRDFFNRFPAYGRNDEVRLALADLHFMKEEYLPARLAYEKMIRMSAGSPLLPRAKYSLAMVLAEHLKEYDAAIAVYREIADSYPGTDEAWAAYGRIPRLAEKQRKYDLAVTIYETIIKLYPDKPEAYAAFQSEARVLRDELSKPAEAIAALNRLADKYKGDKAIEAVFLAADIARKDMKDSALEIKNYDRIVSEYPSGPQAPKALFAAGEAYEKDGNRDKASESYLQIIEKYADDPLAKKAQKRFNSLAGQ